MEYVMCDKLARVIVIKIRKGSCTATLMRQSQIIIDIVICLRSVCAGFVGFTLIETCEKI